MQRLRIFRAFNFVRCCGVGNQRYNSNGRGCCNLYVHGRSRVSVSAIQRNTAVVVLRCRKCHQSVFGGPSDSGTVRDWRPAWAATNEPISVVARNAIGEQNLRIKNTSKRVGDDNFALFIKIRKTSNHGLDYACDNVDGKGHNQKAWTLIIESVSFQPEAP